MGKRIDIFKVKNGFIYQVKEYFDTVGYNKQLQKRKIQTGRK